MKLLSTKVKQLLVLYVVYNKSFEPVFPKDLTSTVQYSDSVKLFCTLLSDFANVSLRKISTILGYFTDTHGTSIGSIDNWKKEIYSKCYKVVKKLKRLILKSPVINNDETPINVSGNKFRYCIGAFTDNISSIQTFKNRRLKSFEDMGILPKYTGVVTSDHYSSYYHFKNVKNSECNVYISRELKYIIELTQRPSALNLYNHLYSIKKFVDDSTEGKLSDEQYHDAFNKWISILDKWDEEFDAASKDKPHKYFNDERKLKNRLRKYAENHLMFAKVPYVKFDNNLAERGLRTAKSKLKACTCFRSFKNLEGYSNFQSIIGIAVKNNLNPIHILKEIFNNNFLIKE